MDPKQTLVRYLARGHDRLIASLDGLDEYEARRPMVTSGTQLLGLVVHVANVEAGYFGLCFDRPFEHPLLVPEESYDVDPLSDMWVGAEVSIADVLAFHAAVRAHATATIDALDLTSSGHVPWWSSEDNPVTLHRILVHQVSELAGHAGHADILRELLDEQAGRHREPEPLPEPLSWPGHRDRVEQAARQARAARTQATST